MFKRWSDFDGKSSRKNYLKAILVHVIFILILYGLSNIFDVLFFLLVIYSLIAIIPLLMLTIRRLHDVDKSAVALFWILVPVLGWIIIVITLLRKSKR